MKNKQNKHSAIRRLWTTALLATVAAPAMAAEVNLYTDRQEVFLREALDAYEKASGVSVNVLFVKKGLLERVRAEGAASPADVFILADIGRVAAFVEAGLAAPVRDEELEAATQPSLRDANGLWYAVTRRARVLFVAPDVNVVSYDDLTDSARKGQVCLRSGAHPYNNALFADIAARKGGEGLKQWLAGVKQNLARKPGGKDRTQIHLVANGECKIGIANSYYYFHLINNADDDTRQRLQNVRMIVPEDANINITGMMRAKHSPNPQAALRLMRFMLSEPAQEILASRNFEFPARTGVEWPPELAPYQSAVENAAPRLNDIAQWRRAASELADETGFDR